MSPHARRVHPANDQPVTSQKPTGDERRLFGKRLKAARTSIGWTQNQLAQACGVGNGMVVSKWESGINIPGDRAPWILHQIFGPEVFAGLWGDEPQVPRIDLQPSAKLTGPLDERVAQAARVLESLARQLSTPDDE